MRKTRGTTPGNWSKNDDDRGDRDGVTGGYGSGDGGGIEGYWAFRAMVLYVTIPLSLGLPKRLTMKAPAVKPDDFVIKGHKNLLTETTNPNIPTQRTKLRRVEPV